MLTTGNVQKDIKDKCMSAELDYKHTQNMINESFKVKYINLRYYT